LKEEALDRTMWRARFGRGFGPVVRQATKWWYHYCFIKQKSKNSAEPLDTAPTPLENLLFCYLGFVTLCIVLWSEIVFIV